MNFLRLLSLVCFAATATIGCSSNVKPVEHAVQSPSVPTMDSILQLLDVLQFDDIAIEVIDLERENLNKKLQGIGAKRHLTPTQRQILDEFIGNALAVVDEEMSVDRVRNILTTTIQQSLSRQDIDAVTIFYRTRAHEDTSSLVDNPILYQLILRVASMITPRARNSSAVPIRSALSSDSSTP